MKKVEAAIQKATIHWVKETYPLVMITATQNENSYKETAQIGSLGITDLILFYRDIDHKFHVFFLELKKTDGKLLPSQKTWNSNFDTNFSCGNASRAVAYGFIDAKIKIKCWYDSIA